MKLIQPLLFLLVWFLAAIVSPLAYSKAPYAGNQSNANTITVPGYTKQNGTYLAPNRTQNNNWSSKPNVNPYIAKEGTKEPQK